MKRKIIGLVIALAALALILGACEILFLTTTPTGNVVDARTNTGIAEVVVTFTPVNVGEDAKQDAVNATSGTDGTFTGPELAEGLYDVTAAKDGYVFIPVRASVAGWSTSIPRILGVAVGAPDKDGEADPNAVSVFLIWERDATDVDAYLSYPATFNTSGVGKTLASIDDVYYDVSTDGARNKVYWDDKDGDTGTANTATQSKLFANLDVDDRNGFGPETMTMIGANTGLATGTPVAVNSSTPVVGGVLAAANYYYMGTAVYYMDAFSSNTSLDNQGVRVVITQGQNIKGIFTPPTNMPQTTASVFRTLLFYSEDFGAYYMVFVPDYRLSSDPGTDATGIKSLDANGAFVVSGSK